MVNARHVLPTAPRLPDYAFSARDTVRNTVTCRPTKHSDSTGADVLAHLCNENVGRLATRIVPILRAADLFYGINSVDTASRRDFDFDFSTTCAA